MKTAFCLLDKCSELQNDLGWQIENKMYNCNRYAVMFLLQITNIDWPFIFIKYEIIINTNRSDNYE